MKHAELVTEAKEAVNKVFGDTSVPKEQTILSLQDIKSNIDISITAIQSDIDEEANDSSRH